ncbi:MAG: acyl-CoA dehydrogenase [Chloroflexi bacterium]|nr:MAG: acyl-CoA dehydrogenase [Chloroflexota bacterium]TME45302.1 MAG: acyl-CoA dehydrogenase [Chloroflexota bacterium]
MDFSLTDEQRMILATVREFVGKELVPVEADVQRAELEGRRFPDRTTLRGLQQKARSAGLWGLLTPEEYGGANVGFLMTALITMETARALFPFAYGGSADNILYQCTPAQRERYLLPTIEGERLSCFALTEPDTGSDATNIKMPAVRKGSDWILNGQKVFITNGADADFAIVFAVTDPTKGYKGGVTAFLVDRAMGWTSRPIQTMGSWGPAELHFENVPVPSENVLGGVGNGFTLAMQWIGQGRLLIPARAVGQAQRLLAMARDYARERIAFGRPIAEYEAIQWMLADSAVEIEEVGWLVLNAAWRADQSGDARHAISMAKLAGAEMIWRVSDRVMQIHGGTGYTKEMPIERVMRDVRVYRIYEGTDEIQRRSIARNLLERGAPIGSWA